jgi:hypothetical protein
MQRRIEEGAALMQKAARTPYEPDSIIELLAAD